MVEVPITSNDRGLPQEPKSEERSKAEIVSKDLQEMDQNSGKDASQMITEYLMARVPIFRELVELRDRVSPFL